MRSDYSNFGDEENEEDDGGEEDDRGQSNGNKIVKGRSHWKKRGLEQER